MNYEHPFRKTALEPHYTECFSAGSHDFLFSVSVTLTYMPELRESRKLIANPLTKINKTKKKSSDNFLLDSSFIKLKRKLCLFLFPLPLRNWCLTTE